MLIRIAVHKKTQKRLDSVVSKVRGNYNGVRVIRAFNKENDEIADFDESCSDRIHRGSYRRSAISLRG